MLRILLTVALSLATHAPPISGPPSDPGPTVGDFTFTDVSEAQIVLLERSIQLFEHAQLDLPPIDIVGHRTDHACRGRPGVHRVIDGRSHIDLCTTDAGPREEFLFLHEIAHAWDRHSLTPERRQEFLELRGLHEWRNDDPERWLDRGAEHAAEIIVWGLIDRPVRIVRLEENGCTDLLAGYRVLTGSEPLHGFTDACLLDGP